MTATWHPLSAVFLPDPPLLATRRMLEMALGRKGRAEVLYAGDRMWPAVRHGDRVAIERCEPSALRAGEIVLLAAGPADLARVVGTEGEGLAVAADADPSPAIRVGTGEVVARAALPLRRSRPTLRRWRRLALDLREAWSGAPDPRGDHAATVRSKYAAQAAFYAASGDDPLPEPLFARIRAEVPPGGRIVVAGSGAGREAVVLARGGFRVRGIDFAAEMVDEARALARRAGTEVEFLHADLRRHREENGSVDAVFFTYDVYSFLPARAERIEMLRAMRRWLPPRGVVYLSARRMRRARNFGMFLLEWLRRGGAAPFGDSHTRWIATDGTLSRSYVHVFPAGSLAREIEAAGFVPGAWAGGHVALRPGREGS